MFVDPSEFGIIPRAVNDTLRLISMSSHEVTNIINAIDSNTPNSAIALDRNAFAGMKNALMIYEVFLCGAGFPFKRNEKIDAAYARLYQIWSKLVQAVCGSIADKSVTKQFSATWSAVAEELRSILERAKEKSTASKICYDRFISALDNVAEAMLKHARRTRRKKIQVAKRKTGELRQEDVAKVFGVTRQTIIRWESTQTDDGPTNTSNPWGYYKSLRTNPELRNAFEMLANQARAYLSAKAMTKKQGRRFRFTFVQFKENWHKHNIVKI